MLLLAHNWPLAKVLGDHTLVAFINEQHRTQREVLLSQPAMQLEVSEEEVEHVSDSDTASTVKDSPGQDERKGLLRACRCTRCEKYIGKVSRLTHAFVHLIVHSFICSFIRSLFVHSLTHSCLPSLIHSFVCLFTLYFCSITWSHVLAMASRPNCT